MPDKRPRTHGPAAILWGFVTLVSGAALLALIFALPLYYASREPYFLNPVVSNPGHLVIRNDDFGEGHFGASRADGKRVHEGLDIVGKIGAPVIAAKSGRVSWRGPRGGYGNLVILRHPDGFETRYGHLSEIRVREGHWVRRGELIGFVGKTGNAKWPKVIPHLHFEVRKNKETLDPMALILHYPESGSIT